MTNNNLASAKPLGQVYPGEVQSLSRVLSAGIAYAEALQIAEQRAHSYDERLYNMPRLRLAAGEVIVRKLTGRCLIATTDGFANKIWSAAITLTGEDQYFIGFDISPHPTEPRQYGHTIIGIEDRLPRLRVNGLAPDGHYPTEPYEMLVTEAEFASLYLAQLSDIDEEQRFYPFRWQPRT